MTLIAVTLLTSFLGAGKTTLLCHILSEQHGYEIAVIENEFGEVSMDDQLIGDHAAQIKTLTNGCICCTRSSELEGVLSGLLDNLDKGAISFNRPMIGCTGMADPGSTIQAFFSHEMICERYLLDDVIVLVDAIHTDEQVDQFIIAQSQVGYADWILLTKISVVGGGEKLRERLSRINARAPIYTMTHGDIDLAQLFDTSGFMLKGGMVSARPRFHSIADRQNGISSIVIGLDYPVNISDMSRVVENLLPGSAEKLLRCKGTLWIEGRPNRLLFQNVQRLYNADWDRPWGGKQPHSRLVLIGINLPEDEIRAAFAGLKKQSPAELPGGATLTGPGNSTSPQAG